MFKFHLFLFRYLPDTRTWIGFREINGTDQWLDGTAVGDNGFDNWASGKLVDKLRESNTKASKLYFSTACKEFELNSTTEIEHVCLET